MSRWHFISFSEEHVRFKRIFVYFIYSFMSIVLYDISLLVNTVCNLTRSVGALSVFVHV